MLVGTGRTDRESDGKGTMVLDQDVTVAFIGNQRLEIKSLSETSRERCSLWIYTSWSD